MNKRVIAAAAAGVLALLGVLVLVMWAQQANDRAFEGAELVSVVRLSKDVDAGTSAKDLAAATEVVELPKQSVPAGAVTELSQVSGLTTNASVQKGEVLLESRMASAGEETEKADTNGVPEGLQEVTISLDAERSVGGAVKVGDKVGVIVTAEFKDVDAQASNFVINQALVTRVDKTIASGEEGNVSATMVTLAVGALDAERVVHGQKWGTVWLTMQNDATDISGGKLINGGDVLR